MGFNLDSLRTFLGVSGAGGLWRLLAIIFALLNLKNLPLGWHLRVANGFLTHLFFSRRRVTFESGPAAVFQPLIVSSRSTVLDCDYNIHKSNSTYFADLDIARAHMVTCLIKSGLQKARKEGRSAVPPHLGGVSCSFKQEIKPYQSYEIWTRVLCWDRKWLYLISHFVEKGMVSPRGYSLQPWRTERIAQGVKTVKGRSSNENASLELKPSIFATSIAKYVFKQGRLTVPPAKMLTDSDLLPPQPEGLLTPPDTITPPVETSSMDAKATSAIYGLSPLNVKGLIDTSLMADEADAPWDWNRVEAERQRGLGLVEFMARLDQAQEEFSGDKWPALGEY